MMKIQHKEDESLAWPALMAAMSNNKTRLVYSAMHVAVQAWGEIPRSYLLIVLGRNGTEKTLRRIFEELKQLGLLEKHTEDMTIRLPPGMHQDV
jgi:hypothetical protein